MLTEESNQLLHLEISATPPVRHQSNKHFFWSEKCEEKIAFSIKINSLPQKYSEISLKCLELKKRRIFFRFYHNIAISCYNNRTSLSFQYLLVGVERDITILAGRGK